MKTPRTKFINSVFCLCRYLSVDHFGNVTCESEEKTEGAKFYVAVANDGTGRWALRNAVRGYFLGAANDKLLCSAKVSIIYKL